MYQPAKRDSLRFWTNRVARTCGFPRLAAITAVVICLVLWALWGRTGEIENTHPPVILVGVLDQIDAMGDEVRILGKVLQNRWEYADAHGLPFDYC
jgi:hypothetical protein